MTNHHDEVNSKGGKWRVVEHSGVVNEERDESVADDRHEEKPDKKQSRLAILFNSHRKLFILLIIAIIIMLLCLAYYLGTMATRGMRGDMSGGVTGAGDDPNAVTIDQDYLNSLNIDPDAGQVVQDYFIHHCFLNLYFKAGQLKQEMPVWNDPGNTEGMVVKLYVLQASVAADQATGQGTEQGTDTVDQALKGDLLFTSGLIAPGMMLSSITLTHELKAGEYKATVVTTPMDADGTAGNSVKSVVDLHVR